MDFCTSKIDPSYDSPLADSNLENPSKRHFRIHPLPSTQIMCSEDGRRGAQDGIKNLQKALRGAQPEAQEPSPTNRCPPLQIGAQDVHHDPKRPPRTPRAPKALLSPEAAPTMPPSRPPRGSPKRPRKRRGGS
eukprot:8621529-Pyramimonas_sp.AAC.1